MYIQRNRIKGKTGEIYSSVFLCSKYRESGKVKTKVIENTLLKCREETLVKLKGITVSKCADYCKRIYFDCLTLILKI
jgi:hypothetical protein